MLIPADYYRGITEADMGKSRRDGEKMQKRLENSKAYSHNILVRTLYIPKIFTDEQEDFLRSVCDTMYDILVRVIERYETDPAYRQLFGFDERLEELILRPRTYPCPLPIARLDVFFNEDTWDFKFCEFNADGASAMNEDKELNKVLSKSRAFDIFKHRFHVRTSEFFDSWAEEFVKIYLSSGNGKKHPHVAIVDFLDGKVNYEFAAFKKAFERAGCTCDICDIRTLRYTHGRLCTPEKTPIDAIYRRAVTCDIMQNYDAVQPFIEAVRDNAVVLIGDFRTQVIHNKIIFKILRDEATLSFLDECSRRFILEHIPYTTRLTEETAAEHNVFREREKWVIKPEDSYASRGVHAGVEFKNDEDWKKAVKAGFGQDYLLQEYCPPYEFPNIDLLRTENAQFAPYSNITGLFVYGGHFQGIYSRIAKNSIISTQYSEMSLPTVIVKERTEDKCI